MQINNVETEENQFEVKEFRRDLSCRWPFHLMRYQRVKGHKHICVNDVFDVLPKPAPTCRDDVRERLSMS